jgi:hypothetical protein
MSATGHHVLLTVREIVISVLRVISSRTVRVGTTEANGFEGITAFFIYRAPTAHLMSQAKCPAASALLRLAQYSFLCGLYNLLFFDVHKLREGGAA